MPRDVAASGAAVAEATGNGSQVTREAREGDATPHWFCGGNSQSVFSTRHALLRELARLDRSHNPVAIGAVTIVCRVLDARRFFHKMFVVAPHLPAALSVHV
jgi:hypothetical protein